MNLVRIKDPKRFAHYRDRRPPWVKIPTALARDRAFRALPDATKAHALMLILRLWRLDQFERQSFPDDQQLLRDAIGATEPVDVDALVEVGFLERWRRPDET